MLDFNEGKVFEALSHLSHGSQCVFSLACSIRLSSVFTHYHDDTLIQIAKLNLNALNTIEEFLCDKSINVTSYSDLLLSKMPDENADYLQPSWGDAVASTYFSIQMCLHNDPMNAVWASRRVYECLDNYILNQCGDSEINEDAVLSSPLIQLELSEQLNDINKLLRFDSACWIDVLNNAKKCVFF